jgi:hypothetical protein
LNSAGAGNPEDSRDHAKTTRYKCRYETVLMHWSLQTGRRRLDWTDRIRQYTLMMKDLKDKEVGGEDFKASPDC